MNSETFRSRVFNLIARSRKALRLYSNVGRFQSDAGNEFTERQTREWKHVTADLLKELTTALEDSKTGRDLVTSLFSIRDRFNVQWRSVESDLNPKQKELIYASENGDFVKAALLSSELLLLKARMQAAQAAHHELDDVIRKSKVTQSADMKAAIQLDSEDIVEEKPAMQVAAKVIPIRKIL